MYSPCYLWRIQGCPERWKTGGLPLPWSGMEWRTLLPLTRGGGGAAGLRAGSTGSPTARGGGTPTTPAAALQPTSQPADDVEAPD